MLPLLREQLQAVQRRPLLLWQSAFTVGGAGLLQAQSSPGKIEGTGLTCRSSAEGASCRESERGGPGQQSQLHEPSKHVLSLPHCSRGRGRGGSTSVLRQLAHHWGQRASRWLQCTEAALGGCRGRFLLLIALAQ